MSVTAPAGFVAAAAACGLKASGADDLSLVATADGRPVPAAATFTTNHATAAPVNVSRRHLEATAGHAAAVVLNSGNANAATGAVGDAHAEQMCALVARGLGCSAQDVLVCSTGLIGIPLPIDKVVAGIPALVDARAGGVAAGQAAAHAIMTTDTRSKQVVVPGPGFSVGGMAKGAAMLAPNMATMLAVLTTDAVADPATLRRALTDAVSRSFNQMTVDGCTSTNDTVIVLASGHASAPPPTGVALTDALWEACADLAGQMAADAEGATKVVRVRVVGAADHRDAAAGARKIAQSQLVKCSFYGQDPYWGRVVSELGSAGIAFELDRVRISYGGVTVCRGGVEATDPAATAALKAIMGSKTIELVADLGLGAGEAGMITCDLGHGYIDENMTTS
ncbi:MAG: bifunctional glutamate N-acetyltransferase/amino-acid acetyltransferase ArgJ [Actinomycetota bacterium]|nr:bifunctional glutamate N-acetyltransferase/amino-acid acetyltransferase ArgJ [Actinomycetota bacterium]